ncbi:MAG: flagellar basal body L-ring protein FlgH [Candidatus Lambdaproteobacteria bacterium]|nr:flagellar basal body L-ring protein FlgH [Candidatus Lambdaproteobacteria bacterium]
MILNPLSTAVPAALAALALLAAGCALQQTGAAPQAQQVTDTRPQERYRTRAPVNPIRNTYEGSLWKGASSWGNLMRDHRARYVGDLLTVTDLAKIIKVPEAKPEPAVPTAEQAAQAAKAGEVKKPVDPILAFLQEEQKRREAIDREQNEILRAIQSIEVEVSRVLSNGNMVVQGTHPPIFRDRNRIRYIVTLRGIVRPSDVDDNNAIASAKLSKAEYRIRRFVKRSTIPPELASAARAADRPQEANFLDRFTKFLTSPAK